MLRNAFKLTPHLFAFQHLSAYITPRLFAALLDRILEVLLINVAIPSRKRAFDFIHLFLQTAPDVCVGIDQLTMKDVLQAVKKENIKRTEHGLQDSVHDVPA